MSDSYNPASYQHNLARREQRKKAQHPADTLIADLRLYFTYTVPPGFHYLFTYADTIMRILQQKAGIESKRKPEIFILHHGKTNCRFKAGGDFFFAHRQRWSTA